MHKYERQDCFGPESSCSGEAISGIPTPLETHPLHLFLQFQSNSGNGSFGAVTHTHRHPRTLSSSLDAVIPSPLSHHLYAYRYWCCSSLDSVRAFLRCSTDNSPFFFFFFFSFFCGFRLTHECALKVGASDTSRDYESRLGWVGLGWVVPISSLQL